MFEEKYSSREIRTEKFVFFRKQIHQSKHCPMLVMKKFFPPNPIHFPLMNYMSCSGYIYNNEGNELLTLLIPTMAIKYKLEVKTLVYVYLEL